MVLTESLTIIPNDSTFSGSTLDIENPTNEELALYDALWDKAFANSADFLEKMADGIREKYRAGLTEDFDPETDPDLQRSPK
jgi:hypothetical protein